MTWDLDLSPWGRDTPSATRCEAGWMSCSACLKDPCVLEQLVGKRQCERSNSSGFTMNNNNNNNNDNKCGSFCSSCSTSSFSNNNNNNSSSDNKNMHPPPIQVTAKVLFGSVTAISALNAERKKKS